jgi:F0F1-type ATP synthase membrane subunit b/b'
MADESGSSQDSADQKIAELERVADDTRNKISAIIAQQKAGRQQTVVATIVIVLIISVFGYKTYTKMQDNFSEDRFQAILKERGPALIEEAKRALNKAKDEVLPVYKEEAMTRAKEVGPLILDKAKVHLSNLPEELRDDLQQRLQRSVDRAQADITTHLQKRFEAVDPDTMAGYLEQLRSKLALKKNTWLDKMTKIFNQERDRVKKVMVNLPVPETENVDMGELDRQLLRAGLEYALFEVNAWGTDDALDLANLGNLVEKSN